MPVMLKEFYQLSEKDRADVAEIFAQAVARAYEESLRREARQQAAKAQTVTVTIDDDLPGADFVRLLRGNGPFLDDEEMHIFDRVKDYGRNIEIPLNYLLDTCVVSELRRRRPNEGVLDWLSCRDPRNWFLSAVTVGELRSVARSAKDPNQRPVIERWIDATVLPMFAGLQVVNPFA